jgi:hypothetical protein
MNRKMDEAIHGNSPCSEPAFSAYRPQPTGKPSAPLERILNFGLETALRSYITL